MTCIDKLHLLLCVTSDLVYGYIYKASGKLQDSVLVGPYWPNHRRRPGTVLQVPGTIKQI